MARLSPEEKAGFLADAKSETRRREFQRLRDGADRALSTDDFLEFLSWSQQFLTEEVSKRQPIKGDTFLL